MNLNKTLRIFNMNEIIIIILLALFSFSCSRTVTKEGGQPIVRVYDKFLYLDELKRIIPSGSSKSDSSSKASNYIDMWIKKQLLIKKAEQTLSEDQKDVDKQLEEYRTSLLIYKLKQKFIEQELDTVVNIKEMEDYYNTHIAEFKLTNNIVNALYIKILKSAPELNQVRYWSRSKNSGDSVQLSNYCKKNATKFDYFNNDWVNLNTLLREVPYQVIDQKEFLLSRINIDVQDSLYSYLLNIKSFKLKGEVTPLLFMKENIKSIILNKRKIMLIDELEKGIYQNALTQDKLEFINNKK
jgi:hypothetical protein